MNWLILELGAHSFEICDGDNRVGIIQRPGDDLTWTVHFVHNDELDFEWDNYDVCVGYVRGIERYQTLLASITI